MTNSQLMMNLKMTIDVIAGLLTLTFILRFSRRREHTAISKILICAFMCILFCAKTSFAEERTGIVPPPGKTLIFSYFKEAGAGGEHEFHHGDGLHLAASSDGLIWTPINNDAPVYAPSASVAFRDPHILLGPDGVFRLVWTAWNSDGFGVGYSSSIDLVSWTPDVIIPIMESEPDARNVWAPETFYDDVNDRYIVFWSTTIPGKFKSTDATGDAGYNHRIYYATTKDFKTFSKTELMYDPGFNCIDATINKLGDGKYLMFLKNETLTPPRKNIVMAKASAPGGPYGKTSGQISPRGQWVEGPSAIFINNKWWVYYDSYTNGKYSLISSPDLKEWSDLSDSLKMPGGIRHGTIFLVDENILRKLQEALKGD